MDYRGIAKYAYRLCETHETIEWHIISSELDAFRIRNTEGMIVQAYTSNDDVVSDNITLDASGAVCNCKLSAGVNKGGGALWTKESVISLYVFSQADTMHAGIHTHAASNFDVYLARLRANPQIRRS